MGHGALATRQKPMYEHWLNEQVDVHCADIHAAKLEDCLPGIHCYVLPDDESKLKSAVSGQVDLLCVNNVPELHLATALQWSMFAKHIVIQKPQDLNFPLMESIATAAGLEEFRSKVRIHDHYRNKSVAAALQLALPSLLTERGQIRRALFVLTEPTDVNDEDRPSLNCGMIQDLAVHMVDGLLGLLDAGIEWHTDKGDDRLHRVVKCEGRIRGCHKYRQKGSGLGDQVETFAAVDLELTQHIEFPAGRPTCGTREHPIRVLIVVGKGVNVDHDVESPLKFISVESENGDEAWIDLRKLTVHGFENLLPKRGAEVNRSHGGLNRPFLLIGPNPPKHAKRGLGSKPHELWQTLSTSGRVARIAQDAARAAARSHMQTYPRGRALPDLLRKLVSDGIISEMWRVLPPFTKYLSTAERPREYYD